MRSSRKIIRDRIHKRIRKRVNGTAERPRLAVHFSGKHVYAQVIDDDAGKTLAAATTTEKAFGKAAANSAAAEKIGKAVAERLLAKNVDKVLRRHGKLTPEDVRTVIEVVHGGTDRGGGHTVTMMESGRHLRPRQAALQ